MADVSINARDLKAFSRNIRKASKKTGTNLRKAEKAAAEVVAIRAREIVGEVSPKVAATVRTFTQGASFGVQTGNDAVPLGKLLEVGNASSNADLLRSHATGGFKHPVFAVGPREDWHWARKLQPMRPHLGPAALQKQGKALDLLLEGVNDALRDVRLEME